MYMWIEKDLISLSQQISNSKTEGYALYNEGERNKKGGRSRGCRKKKFFLRNNGDNICGGGNGTPGTGCTAIRYGSEPRRLQVPRWHGSVHCALHNTVDLSSHHINYQGYECQRPSDIDTTVAAPEHCAVRKPGHRVHACRRRAHSAPDAPPEDGRLQ